MEIFTDHAEGFCPVCNRQATLDIGTTFVGDAPQQLFDTLEPGEEGLCGARYTLAFCPGCRTPFLIVSADSEPSGIPHRIVLFPKSTRRSIAGLPGSIQRAFESALSCFETGNYEPFVIMCRKCLEGACAALGATDGTLASRLRQLKDTGRIESRFYEWGHELRTIGNEGAHVLDAEITNDDAKDCLEFTESLLIYVFTLDRRLRDFRERRQRSKGGKATNMHKTGADKTGTN